MRRIPPLKAESHEEAKSSGVPGSRVQRLQVLLFIALGLWFIDSGIHSEREMEPAPLDEPSSVVAATLVSDSSPGSGTNSGNRAEAFDAEDLERLLRRVNPNLAPSEMSRISAAVFRSSEKYELDPELVTAVLLVESSARPWVRSPKGAMGLMQVMPHMMEPLALAGNAATIESNIEAGCWILAGNIRRLGEQQGISSYFWGSDIRGLAYLEKVEAARAQVRSYRAS